jgi:chromosome segregation ATPase
MGLFDWLNHAKRLSELEDVCAHLSHRMDEEELKYTELRARTKRMLDRTEKAQARVESTTTEHPNGEAAEVTVPGPLGRLSEHQREIQQKILRRRAGI